nr:G protein-coupled receptor [Proales similis]
MMAVVKIYYFALLYMAYVHLTDTLNDELSNPTDKYCVIGVEIRSNEPLSRDDIDGFNQLVSKCRSKKFDFSYRRISRNEPGGEKLAYLTENLFPLLPSNFTLGKVLIDIIGAIGISVEFKLKYFQSASEITVQFRVTNLRLLNSHGSIGEHCSSLVSETSPFSSEQPFELSMQNGMKYYANTCQQIFNRANISELFLAEITVSMVKHNRLTFAPTNQTLNSSVVSLILTGYRIRFDSHLFPLATFAQTTRMLICCIVISFEASSLENSSVWSIGLLISQTKRFLHNNPNWLDKADQRAANQTLFVYLNGSLSDNSIDSSEAHLDYISEIESKRENPFEDSSFCIFYRIEQNSLNVMFFGSLLLRLAQKNCTCLLFWIFSHNWARIDFSAYYYSDLGLCVRDQVEMAKRCNYDKMGQRCLIETVEPINYRTFYDTILDLEYFKYLVDVWLVPVTSLLGIIANYFVIRTFRRIKRSPEYRRNKLTDKSRFMWEYTYFNSWFILFHGLIFLLSPLTTCIELNGIYCSSFISTDLFRPFYLFVDSFLGNTFRLAANMSSTLFVLFRFSLNADRFKWFRELKPKKSLAGIIILSLVISLVTLFGNEKFSVHQLSEDSFFYLLKTESPVLLSSLPVKIAYFVNKLAGTTLFTLLNISIDLRLLYILRKKNVQRPKEEAENRITKMVIINGLFSFLFRLPEMISVCLLLAFYFDQLYFPSCLIKAQRHQSVCPMLFSVSRFLLTISYLENLILLYLFNPSFRKNLSSG